MIEPSETPKDTDMDNLTKVSRHGQITLPASVRRTLGIEEGDLVQITIEDERVVLVPKRLTDRAQAYFWTDEWQAGQREASQDIAAGRTSAFPSASALINDLESQG